MMYHFALRIGASTSLFAKGNTRHYRDSGAVTKSW